MRIGRKRYSKPGTPPGQVARIEGATPVEASAITFGPGVLREERLTQPWDGIARPAPGEVTWIRVIGTGDATLLTRLGDVFGLHPLALEDAVNLGQRPKFETYESHQVIIIRAIEADQRGLEQVSIFFREGLVVSIEERPPCLFDPVVERLRREGSPMRTMGADYLTYALIDRVLDGFFPALDALADRVEALDIEVVESATRMTMGRIHALKREVLALRHGVAPARDAIAALQRDAPHWVTPVTRTHLRDCQDHAIFAVETLDTHREILSSMTDAYLSSISNRTNEVMKVLTLIATIFMPLTFIVGIYGMNFDPDAGPFNMPELKWGYGYVAILAFMALLALGMVLLFRRKRWVH